MFANSIWLTKSRASDLEMGLVHKIRMKLRSINVMFICVFAGFCALKLVKWMEKSNTNFIISTNCVEESVNVILHRFHHVRNDFSTLKIGLVSILSIKRYQIRYFYVNILFIKTAITTTESGIRLLINIFLFLYFFRSKIEIEFDV